MHQFPRTCEDKIMPTDGRQIDEQTETNLPLNFVGGGYTCTYTLKLLIFTSSSKVPLFHGNKGCIRVELLWYI